MCIVFLDIQLLLPPMPGATPKEKSCEEVHGVGVVEIVSKIMYVGLVTHIVCNAYC